MRYARGCAAREPSRPVRGIFMFRSLLARRLTLIIALPLIAGLTACGNTPEEAPEARGVRRDLNAVQVYPPELNVTEKGDPLPVDPLERRPALAGAASASSAETIEPDTIIWAEPDGEDIRMKYVLGVKNNSDTPRSPAFVELRQESWIIQNGERIRVGGGGFAIPRALKLDPEESASLMRGDLTTLGMFEFRRGSYDEIGIEGVITLQDEAGERFDLEFRETVVLTADAEGRPVASPADEMSQIPSL
jgi:hypothetical protein